MSTNNEINNFQAPINEIRSIEESLARKKEAVRAE